MRGAVDRLVFEAFMERVLVPSLRPGQIVVLDNLSVHKSARARTLVETAGCHLVFLPDLLAGLQSHRAGLRQDQAGVAPHRGPLLRDRRRRRRGRR